MAYVESYQKRLTLGWKLKKYAFIGLILGALVALSIWTLSKQEGLMIGKCLSGREGTEMLQQYGR